MRYQAALRPDWPAHLGSPSFIGKVRREAEWLGDGEKAKQASGLGGCSQHCWPCPRCTCWLRSSAQLFQSIAAGPSRRRARPSTSRTTASTSTSSCRRRLKASTGDRSYLREILQRPIRTPAGSHSELGKSACTSIPRPGG